MRFINIIIFLLISGVNLDLFGESLPPLGKREYFLNQLVPSEPVDIQPIQPGKVKAGVHMRDPLALDADLIVKKSQLKAHGSTPKRISHMVFEQTAIKGRYLIPRVTFNRPILAGGRREAPIEVDYRKKLGESERELREFDW